MENENLELKGLDVLENVALAEDGEANEDFYHDPQQEAEAEAKASAEEAAAEAGAAFITGMLETGVTYFYPFVSYEDSQREMARDRLKPLCMKYGGEMPEWLQPWREEIEAATFFTMVGIQTYMQVKAHKAAEEAEKEAARGDKSKHSTTE